MLHESVELPIITRGRRERVLVTVVVLALRYLPNKLLRSRGSIYISEIVIQVRDVCSGFILATDVVNLTNARV